VSRALAGIHGMPPELPPGKLAVCMAAMQVCCEQALGVCNVFNTMTSCHKAQFGVLCMHAASMLRVLCFCDMALPCFQPVSSGHFFHRSAERISSFG
jgi:hypothetical protein